MRVILLGWTDGNVPAPEGFTAVAGVSGLGEALVNGIPLVKTVRHAMRFSPDAALLLAESGSVLPGTELEMDVLNALESGLDVYCVAPDSLAERECFRHASKLTGALFLGIT